jgi:mRNA-degrading endonuclease RelE of RelBE toxin-antitoxin system|nr:type II toxin-antitoxin system RelE/ParE family toxin [uncultured Flavobacterium sp.]
MYSSQYFDEVFTDIQETKIWYKEQKEGLEVEFAFAIEKAIEQVLKMPSAYSTRYKNVRIAHPKTFPYNIHFYIDEDSKTVVFTAIIHNKRNPKLAISRIV